MSGEAAQLSDLEALRALGEPTRRRLYEAVAEAEAPLSREDAARAAGIDRSLAAYHLDKLVEYGLVEATYARPPGRSGPGAGRPAKRYQRARREFVLRTPARDYRLLAELLVEAVSESGGEIQEAIGRAARDLGRRLGAAAAADEENERSLDALLRGRGYEPAEVEPGLVRLRNCPFHTVAACHPGIVCGLNLELIQGMLEGLGHEPGRALLAPEEGVCCVAIQTGTGEKGIWR